ncbi:nuclease-related domain-containing protein [Psychrobacter sp. GP33]|uniref:nuclease-related domain-containing protein n=1 Tax=Psychrobacter sp. GP33 TaxID=2758709 RepID=UPI0015FC734E|nr:NERD domain-containing protein [Psychrobacter sp. GP33]
MSLMSNFKGFVGETVINLVTWLMLDKKTYHRLNNITLPLANGGSTQIDHVIVSIYGIFVIETKHYKGWIFGSERQAQWTQSIMGRKYKFQNPLRQNYLHIKTLAELLTLDMYYFHSMIVFIGECKLKTSDKLPKNVMKSGMVTYIKDKQNILLTEADVQSIVEQIETNRFAKSWRTNRQHKAYLKNKHSDAGNQLKNIPVKGLNAKPIAGLKAIPKVQVAFKPKEVNRCSGQVEQDKSPIDYFTNDNFMDNGVFITPFALAEVEPINNENFVTEPVNHPTISTSIPACPKCNGEMIERIAKKGARQGQVFFSCTQFPKCWGIVNIN